MFRRRVRASAIRVFTQAHYAFSPMLSLASAGNVVINEVHPDESDEPRCIEDRRSSVVSDSRDWIILYARGVACHRSWSGVQLARKPELSVLGIRPHQFDPGIRSFAYHHLRGASPGQVVSEAASARSLARSLFLCFLGEHDAPLAIVGASLLLAGVVIASLTVTSRLPCPSPIAEAFVQTPSYSED